MKDLILLATTKELKLIEKLNLKNNYDVRIMGVGSFNVFRTLSNINLTEYRKVYNIGYAGGEKIGMRKQVDRVVNRGHFDNEDIDLEVFNLVSYFKFFYSGNLHEKNNLSTYKNKGDYNYSHEYEELYDQRVRRNAIACETGDYFHTEEIQENKVYDMELWYIAKYLYHKNTLDKLIAYKVVSDNGDMKEYEENSN